MLKHFNTKSWAAVAFIFLAGCGGGGGGDTATAPSQSPTSGSGDTPQPALAAAISANDGSTLGTTQWPDGSADTGGLGQEVGGLNCSAENASYTYTQLILLQNGQQLAIPADIGKVNPAMGNPAGCVYPVHTSDRSGKIRVNASTGATYTLGQFFSVWGQPLSSNNVAGISGATTIYLNDNGTLTKFTGDPATIELRPQRQIVVMTGTAVTQIPNYSWQNPPPLVSTPIVLEEQTLGTPTWPAGNSATGGSGDPVGNAQCPATFSENYHVHMHIAIYNDGQQLAIPQNIGVLGTCLYDVHTHDMSGVVHIEADAYRRFTLGDFFGIWGQPLSTTNVAGITDKPVVVYINDKGNLRRFIGDPASIELTSQRSVIIQIGTPLTEIPTYSWVNVGTF